MFKPLIISLCLLPLTLTTQACGQSVEVIEKSNTTPVTFKAVVPKSVPMTLEEIRAEQVKLEAQIAEIKAKGELERVDKIALLKLMRRYDEVLDAGLKIQQEISENYDVALRNLSSIKTEVEN